MTAVRIAYVINSVEGGGAALPVPAVAGVLRDCGATVKVFALTGRDRRALPAMAAAGLDPAVREGGEKDHLAAFFWLRRELQAWGATHIWTSLSRATLLGLLVGPALGLPVISWQHAAYLKPWNRRLMRLLQARARLWVGDSRSVTKLTAARLHVPADRLTTWPIFSADPDMPPAQPWRPGKTVRLGSLGRLHPVKGYDVLIAALAVLKANGFSSPAPFTVTVAGDGAEGEALRAQAAAAGVPVAFPGYAERPREFLAGLHLYVQPSRSEGFCLAVHEAMTAGLAAVASAVGEMPFSIRPGITGATVPPGDPEALAAALKAMLADPGRLAVRGAAARRSMLETYSRERFVAAGRAIFERIK